MVLLTEIDRKWFPVLRFWLHWISISITSTINSLIGKDTGSLEVSWIRLPFHKVLVFKTIELSKSVLSATGNESPQYGTLFRSVSPSCRWVLAQTFISLQGAGLLPTQILPVVPLARDCN